MHIMVTVGTVEEIRLMRHSRHLQVIETHIIIYSYLWSYKMYNFAKYLEFGGLFFVGLLYLDEALNIIFIVNVSLYTIYMH